jgi:hypothetical protein
MTPWSFGASRYECDRYDDVTNGRPYLVTWGEAARASLWFDAEGNPGRHIYISRKPNRRGYSPPSTTIVALGTTVLAVIQAQWPELKASADQKKEGSQ